MKSVLKLFQKHRFTTTSNSRHNFNDVLVFPLPKVFEVFFSFNHSSIPHFSEYSTLCFENQTIFPFRNLLLSILFCLLILEALITNIHKLRQLSRSLFCSRREKICASFHALSDSMLWNLLINNLYSAQPLQRLILITQFSFR